MTTTLSCPKCGTPIEISAALESSVRKDVEADLRKNLEAEAKRKASEALHVDIAEKDQALAELKGRVKEFQDQELQLRKRQRELDEKAKSLKLEAARQLDKVRDEERKKMDEEHRLKDAEKDKLLTDMKGQLQEMKRRVEQGSQQTQGDIAEIDLLGLLTQAFPDDKISRVGKGVKGTDVVQVVVDATSGSDCGSIVWERKHTASFKKDWLSRIRSNQHTARATCCCIVTTALPPGIETFGEIEGVWITSRQCVVPLASAIRGSLIQIAKAQRAMVGRGKKMDMVYEYLMGSSFKGHITGIAETFMTLLNETAQEERAMQAIWAKRRRQLERAAACATGLYGELQALMNGLPQIEAFELPQLEAEPDLLANARVGR